MHHPTPTSQRCGKAIQPDNHYHDEIYDDGYGLEIPLGRRPEVPEERATATHGKEKEGETEVNVPEEEGAAQVAMEMEE